MDTERSRTAAGLSSAGPADISALGREIRSRVSAGHCGWAGALGAEIASRARDADSRENDGTVLGDVLRALAAGPGPDSLRELLRVRQFWTPDPVRAEDFPAVLERLPLTAWPAEEGPAAPHPATPDTVFRALLTAAVRSPAYGSGLHGAYGRLAARHSLAGLTGVPADRPLTGVAEAAGRTTWLRIAPSTSWFSAIVWDVAVAALRPGGQEIAVPAATDSE
ncbi:DUF6183 family protein [Streptomyces sp. YPW6]|uniref:DUF6183 family protein n=1 Tax=Streptomyces sp. YPW6 TaxID=2840373 RepID=UPI003EBBC0A8